MIGKCRLCLCQLELHVLFNTDRCRLSCRQAYVDMRKIGSGRGMVSAYPRQLESLIRLAEAHAKVRFSEKVETIDVEEAKRLHREALKQSATDPRTGLVDITILTTGKTNMVRVLIIENKVVCERYSAVNC